MWQGCRKKWRARYFERKGDAFIVKQSLRKHIVFAPHNLLIDSPFYPPFDFISLPKYVDVLPA
ncbi:CheR family methyltransferase [Bacillus pumilus]|nr:CheR family methyltransferase [Bacillus pumilus]